MTRTKILTLSDRLNEVMGDQVNGFHWGVVSGNTDETTVELILCLMNDSDEMILGLPESLLNLGNVVLDEKAD